MMDSKHIGTLLNSTEYDFLRQNENLGSNIIMLGFGGSHAYGTNNENSDVDIRGIATRTKRDILTGEDFKQVVDVETDTTIYSLDKIVTLLCSCNPNTIEMLGLRPDHYIYLTDAGRMLIENRQDKIEFKCINAEVFHQIVKHYYELPITEDDLVFYHDGQLARFMKEVDNPWVDKS